MNRSLLAVATVILVAAPAAAEDPFTLESTTVGGGDSVTLTFPTPLDPANKRYWVCLVKKGDSDSTYGEWAYVADGASSATLKAPATNGNYEVRLHSGYPEKSNNVIHRVAIQVAGLPPTPPEDMKFVFEAGKASVDTKIKVRFKAEQLVPAAKEKFWVAIVPAGAPPEAQGLWTMVPIPATEVVIPAATSTGKHELRLHANYPTQSRNLVHSLPIEITGPADAAPTTDSSAIGAALAEASVAHGATTQVTFKIPLRPITGERFWVSLTHANVPETAAGLWSSVKVGSTSVELPKPLCTGKHRVQLHANAPTQSRNPIATLELTVTGPPEKAPTDPSTVTLTLDQATIAAGSAPKVSFGRALIALTGEKYWVTVIPTEKGDGEWGQYTYVPNGATEVELAKVEKPGSYEVRLHANHPTQPSNLVQRVSLTVE